jgi:ABC-2 type transport system permease protein
MNNASTSFGTGVSPSLGDTQSSPIADFLQETTALTRRWFIQLKRRPTTLIAGIVQPLVFLILFGALFQGAPRGTFIPGDSYLQFLAAGIIVFTAFGGALNSGVAIIFDREFGFLNRILVAPLTTRFAIVLASAIFIIFLSLVQTSAVLVLSLILGAKFAAGIGGLFVLTLAISLLVLGFTALSLGLAFGMPGHVEMLALIFVVNLPLLFASTALAPITFMPSWLQVIVSLNPLTHAIEPVRYLYTHSDWNWTTTMFQAPWGAMSLEACLLALLIFDLVAVGLSGLLIKKALG